MIPEFLNHNHHMEEQFLNIIENFKNQKILVVGDLMLDQYLIGSVERISHEAPIPILDVKEISQPITFKVWEERYFWPA